MYKRSTLVLIMFSLALLVVSALTACGGGDPEVGDVSKQTRTIMQGGWSEWGGSFGEGSRFAPQDGPHNTVTALPNPTLAHDSEPVSNTSFKGDPIVATKHDPGVTYRVYTTDTNGGLFEFTWDATETDIQAPTQIVADYPGVTNCASTPSMDYYGDVYYNRGNQLTWCRPNNAYLSYNFSVVDSGNPFNSPLQVPDSGGGVTVYFQGTGGPSYLDPNTVNPYLSLSYTSGASGAISPTYFSAQLSALGGLPNMTQFFKEDVYGWGTVGIEAQRANPTVGWIWERYFPQMDPNWTPANELHWLDGFDSSQDAINSLVVLDNTTWLLGKTLAVTPEEMSTWQPDIDPPFNFEPYDYVKNSSAYGMFASLPAVRRTVDGWDVYIIEQTVTMNGLAHRLSRYTIDNTGLVLSSTPVWSSAPWTTGHNGTHPTIDVDGYVYLTTMAMVQNNNGGLPGGGTTLALGTQYQVFNPDTTTPIYTYDVGVGDVVDSSPSIGGDNRVYLTTNTGVLHSWWDL